MLFEKPDQQIKRRSTSYIVATKVFVTIFIDKLSARIRVNKTIGIITQSMNELKLLVNSTWRKKITTNQILNQI